MVYDRVPEATEALDRLRNEVGGEYIAPGDPDYDEARAVWNGMIDRYPLAIIRAASTDDVAPVLRAVRETSLPLAVRGGGHSVSGHSAVDDGIVLDLGGLREVTVDPETRLVIAAPGARAADVDAATAPHSLAVPLGTVSEPGIAGMALGGGVGWLVRKAGLTLDALERAEVMTADGTAVTASAEEHHDLFWGLRGGGGNFGVVTSFTLRAVPMPEAVLGASLFYRRPSWRRALVAFERWSRDLPDDLGTILQITTPPQVVDHGADPWLMIHSVWLGEDPELGEQHLERLAHAAPPDDAVSGLVSWPAWQGARDDLLPTGSRGVWRNVSFSHLDEDALDRLLDVADALPSTSTELEIRHLGGAFARVAEDATAFPHRAARFMLSLHAMWDDPSEDAARTGLVERARAAIQRLEQGERAGEYVNLRALEHTRPVAELSRDAYGEETYRRLQHVKQVYDPGNMFRQNYNIAP